MERRLKRINMVMLVLATLFMQPLLAQPPIYPTPPALTLGSPNAAGLPTSIAIAGNPFGVAKIELPLAMATSAERLSQVEVSDDEGRVLYPVTRDILADLRTGLPPLEPAPGQARVGGGRLLRRVGELVRQATADADKPLVVSRELLFLFRGDQPLRVRIGVPDAAGRTEFLLNPVLPTVPTDHAIAMNRWWATFSDVMKKQMDAGDYPAIIESYLIAELAGRLDLPLPADFVVNAADDDPSLVSTLGLIAGTEKIRSPIFRRAAIGRSEPVPLANLPLPSEPHWSPVIPPLPQVAPAIEPIATRVPPECFYIRYGSFENYLWFRDLSEEYGGDIGRMVALRGSDDGAAQRIEVQLNLKMTALARVLGGSVIEDQAIVGRDLFLSEGASIGVMFRAKNAYLLQTSMNADRTALAKADVDVKLTTETILGREVSFLRTIDNRIRSFMVVDGEYIYVTNSRTLATRFIEVGKSGDSLAATPEFILARQLTPGERGDSVFAYFSPAMLRGLVSPGYLIEMRRRLYSFAEMSLVRLARLASATEGDELLDPIDLVEAGYLPREFGNRSDGSGVIVVGDEIVDSLRGRAGSLLPIADVDVNQVTAAEHDWYGRIAAYHESKWQQIDPIFVGVRRSELPEAPGLQRLEIHAEVAPLVPDKYGEIAKQLGPPTRVKIDFAPDDIVAVQAHVVSDQLKGMIPPHHLFAAIKDTVLPRPEQFSGLFKAYQALQLLPGYLGAWPQPGLLDRLPLGIGRGQEVGPGLSRLIGGVYRYQGNGFSIVSMQSEVLVASLPFLAATEADDVAQVRARVGNLRGTQLESWVNAQLYERSEVASHAGANLLGLLSRELKVAPDQAQGIVEQLLGGRLQDPLGGNYTLAKLEGSGTVSRWVSDAWREQNWTEPYTRALGVPTQAPPGYVAPVLKWFRGGHVELTQYADRFVTNLVIDIERTGPRPSKDPLKE